MTKALAAAKTSRLPRSYWDWNEQLAISSSGYFPYTPATNMLYGLHESIAMLLEEGLALARASHDSVTASPLTGLLRS